jgi:hypothetical protein
LGIHEHTQFHSPTLSGLNLHPPQKFERPPFEMVKAMELKHGIRVPLKIGSNVIRVNRQTDTQCDDLIILTVLL